MRKAGAVVAAFAALAAGCGGGGGERLSRDAYVAKADAICRQLNAARSGVQAPASLAGIPAYVDRVLPAVDTALSQLRALRPPADMELAVKGWLVAVGDFRSALASIRSGAASGDAEKVRGAGAKGTNASRRASTLAGALGLTDCATAG